MFDAIDFLEQIGKDASLRYRRPEQLDDAASRRGSIWASGKR